jgi:hypothetical protein
MMTLEIYDVESSAYKRFKDFVKKAVPFLNRF